MKISRQASPRYDLPQKYVIFFKTIRKKIHAPAYPGAWCLFYYNALKLPDTSFLTFLGLPVTAGLLQNFMAIKLQVFHSNNT